MNPRRQFRSLAPESGQFPFNALYSGAGRCGESIAETRSGHGGTSPPRSHPRRAKLPHSKRQSSSRVLICILAVCMVYIARIFGVGQYGQGWRSRARDVTVRCTRSEIP